MHERIRRTFPSTRPELRVRWEALLRQAPVPSPLGAPDGLVHSMDWTLEEFFKKLTSPPNRRRLGALENLSGTAAYYCSCGSNPLQTYFSCLKKTLAEALEKISKVGLCRNVAERDLIATETEIAFALVSNRELKTLCSVSLHSQAATDNAAGGGEAERTRCPLAHREEKLAASLY